MRSVLFALLFASACVPQQYAPPLEGEALDKAIVGAETSAESQFGHFVVVEDRARTFRCSGSVVAPGWVLTNARCVEGMRPADIEVRFGALYVHSMEVTSAKSVVSHPDYVWGEHHDDLALVEVETPFDFGVAALLADQAFEDENIGGRLWLTGLDGGYVSFGDLSHDPTCESYSWVATDEHMCSLTEYVGTAACHEWDFGAPLVVAHGNQWVQVGLAASTECGFTLPSSMFTRVATHLDWIRSVVPEVTVVGSNNPPPTGDDHGDTVANATPMGLESNLSGTLAPGDSDVFAFTVPEAGILMVGSESEHDLVGQLLDASGAEVAFNDDRPGDLDFLIEVQLEPGDYYLVVTGYGDAQSGAYALGSSFGPDAPWQAFPDAIEATAPFSGVVDVPVQGVALYAFELPPGVSEIHTDGALDTTLRIYDVFGIEIQFDDDSGADTNASISNVAGDSLVYVEVGTYDQQGGSTFLVVSPL